MPFVTPSDYKNYRKKALNSDRKLSKVEIAIFNIIGEKINTIHNGNLETGRHLINWDGRSMFDRKMSTGIYFIRMIAKGKVLTRKILLLK